MRWHPGGRPHRHAHLHPLVSISLGVAFAGKRRFLNPVEAAGVATEMKNHAKRIAGSVIAVDRRTPGAEEVAHV